MYDAVLLQNSVSLEFPSVKECLCLSFFCDVPGYEVVKSSSSSIACV